ncbi:MAG TPA: ATP synthase F1 subunit delta [Candidatus Binatia bacterium]|nr:ATP synthase F1 subunit delta [Candidatus Binatia bacterium]
MIEGSLSRRYSKALFQLARESGAEEEIGQEIERFYAVFSSSELQPVLTNPAFNLETRKKILLQVAAAQQLSSLAGRFLSLLLDRGRLAHLGGIVSRYRRLLNENKGRIEAKMVSAGELEAAAVERLRARLGELSGKEVVLQKEVDPELLGGLLVELGGTIYDGSVRTQLDKMKQRIARGY